MRYLKVSNSQREKTEWWLPGPGAEENEKLMFNGNRISVGEDERVLEMDSGNVFTTM